MSHVHALTSILQVLGIGVAAGIWIGIGVDIRRADVEIAVQVWMRACRRGVEVWGEMGVGDDVGVREEVDGGVE